ncbi:MAG: DUF2071 domain-containing protein [Fimbriimonas sp.]
MKNRITMAGHIEPCWLFVFRGEAERLRELLPEPLNLLTEKGFAFVNVVVCHLRGMRPAAMPIRAGLSYWHIAYRLYAESPGQQGLYFMRSDADSPLIVASGNLLTSFHFHHARVRVQGRHICIEATGANLSATISEEEQTTLAAGSPFGTLREASEFLKYKPAALIPVGGKTHALRITRDEAAWKSRLVQVEDARFEYLKGLDLQLELCYEVEPIDYVWNRAEVLA